MAEKTIKFSDLVKFSDKQQQAHNAINDYKFLLYGGAVGGGKSFWLRWELIYRLLKFAKEGYLNVSVGLFCEDYPALKDRHLSKIGVEFPAWLGQMHSDHKNYGRCYILNKEYGSGVIVFRNLDDPSKYQSAEFAIIAIDELTKNNKETFDDLLTRLRWAGIPNNLLRFIAGTNPGGTGHAWVKKWWVDRDFDDSEKELEPEFKYIQALATDNPYLSPEYKKSLDALPDDKRRAFRDGDWDIFKGQFFSEFRRDIHVIKPHKIEFTFKKFVCGDYGYSAPSAVYWCYTDFDGRIIVYRELYRNNLTYENLMREIIRLTPNDEIIDYYVFDPAIWAKKGEVELSGVEIMEDTYRAVKGKMPMFIKGDNQRIIGWNLMREYLKPQQDEFGLKTAKLQIFDTCDNLIRTLPGLVYDKRKVEDCDTNGEDHGPDSIRYGIMSRPPISVDYINPLNTSFKQKRPKIELLK